VQVRRVHRVFAMVLSVVLSPGLVVALTQPASAVEAVTVVSPAPGTTVDGDFEVTVTSAATRVAIGFRILPDPNIMQHQGIIDLVDGVGQITLSTRGVPAGAELFACDAGFTVSCSVGQWTLVPLNVVNQPVTMASVEDGDVLTPDTMLDLANPYTDAQVQVRAGEYITTPTGIVRWVMRGDVPPFDGGQVRLGDLTYEGPRGVGGGDFEIRATGCEHGTSLGRQCWGTGTRVKVAIDAPLRVGLIHGGYRASTNLLQACLCDRKVGSEVTYSVLDLKDNVLIGPVQLGFSEVAHGIIEFPAVDNNGVRLPNGLYKLKVDVKRDSIYAATPMVFTGTQTVYAKVDDQAPEILSSSISKTTLTTVPDRPAQTARISVHTNEPTAFRYTIEDISGQVWALRNVIPPGDETLDTFDFDAWVDSAETPDVEPFPPGDYTVKLNVMDRSRNTADHTLGTITVRKGHWVYRTVQTALTNAASRVAKVTPPCTVLLAPASRGWPGSLEYRSASDCPDPTNGMVKTKHSVAFPKTKYRVLRAAIRTYGGAALSRPNATAEMRGTVADSATPHEWSRLGARLGWHNTAVLKAADLSGLSSLDWTVRAGPGSHYDVKSFSVSFTYEAAIEPD
jgi:hypothetical protein